MVLENEFFQVEISIDRTYTVGSADNRLYDLVLAPGNPRRSDWTKTFAIQVAQEEETYSIALTGGPYCYAEDCALLEGKILTVLQDHAFVQIDLAARSLISYHVFSCLGCTLGLHACPGGYLVHGELEILKFDLAFQELWRFSAGDIFVTQEGEKEPFSVEDGRIRLCDWEGCRYELDLDGKLIAESKT